MKKNFINVIVVSLISFLVLIPTRIKVQAEGIENNKLENVVEILPIEIEGVSEYNEVEVLSPIDNQIFQFDDFESTIPKTRSATGYTYKGHVVLSTKTYKNKELKRLKTSKVWSTAANSAKPTINVTTSRSYSVSTTLNNGTGNFGFSQSFSISAGESYSATPKKKGNKATLGLYATKVVA